MSRLLWPLLLLGSLLQQPGRTTFDTKFDLSADPGAFLSRSLHLWNPQASFGELQNQAYGYLFPHGPWFLVMDAVGVPDWVAQRLWSGLLLVLAYEGCRQLAKAMGLGGAGALVAGLAYALSPRIVGASGVLTGELGPVAMLPWAVLPLVLARQGRWSPRTAALLSGVAVLCMGGINAVGTLATLPACVAVLLAQVRLPHGRRLLGWWLVAMALACAWWLFPLLLLGRYSPPFLDYIETASATTATTAWSNAVRGTEHWVAWSTAGDRAWWPGPHALVTTPSLVVLGGLVAGLGLAFLAHPRMPWRGPLLATGLIGLLCLVAGAGATGGSLVDGWVRDLLDGPLAALRNVHKVDPLVRLPLALGLGHAVVRIAEIVERRWRDRVDARGGDPETARPIRGVRRGVAATLAAVLLVGAAPLWTNGLRTPGWTEVPRAWEQASAWLDEADGSRAIVVPGAGFGVQTWGWTIDEPLQGIATTPWVTRSQVPLVPGPTAQWLDAVEERMATGRGSRAMVAFLARAGVTHVVLRRDIDGQYTDTADLTRVESALRASPGVRHVAGFGGDGFGRSAVEIWEVTASAPRAQLTATDRLRRLNGAPVDLLRAGEGRMLAYDEPVIIDPETGAGDLVGDGSRRRERQFGRVHDSLGATMTQEEQFRSDRPSHDFAQVEGIAQSVVRRTSGVEVSASSSAGYVDSFGAIRPDRAPGSAYDGDADTAWRSAAFTDPRAQWWELTTPAPLPQGTTVAIAFEQAPGLATPTRVDVRIGDATTALTVPDSGVVVAPVTDADADDVRVTVREVAGTSLFGTVGISEVTVPELQADRTVAVPGTLAAGTDLVLGADPPRRACLDIGSGVRCDRDGVTAGEEVGLDRTVEVAEAGRWRFSGTVVPVAGEAVADLLAPLGDDAWVRADHVRSADPAAAGVFAFDGRDDTAWLGEPRRREATLTWRWTGRARTIDRIRVVAADQPSVRPTTAVIRSGGEVRRVRLDGLGTFEPLRVAGRIRIDFEAPEGVGEGRDLPMGLAEVILDGAEGLRHAPDRSARVGASCGLGPEVVIDGRVHRTSVTGQLADLLRGSTLRWEACGGPVALSEGTHRIQVAPTVQFAPDTLAFDGRSRATDDPDAGAGTPRSTRSMEVLSWDATERALEVGAGEEAVLRIAENTNPGWRAELNGEELRTVTLDGWQQGYVVPAGEGGTVTVTFTPDKPYRASLVLGGLLALVLLIGAGVGVVRERAGRRTTAAEAPEPGAVAERTGLLARWPAFVALGVALAIVGGPWAGLGTAAALLVPRRVSLAAGGAAVAVSGVAAAWVLGGQPEHLANGAAAFGVGMLVGAATRPHGLLRSGVVSRLPRPTVDRLTAVALLLVAGQALLRSVLAAGSWFWQDDFRHLFLAHDLGFSSDFLVRDYSGHLEIGQYVVYWLIAGSSHDFTVAAVVLVALQVLVSLLLWSLLRTLFPASPWLLVPFAAYLFTPLGLITGAWFAAGLQALPLQLFLLTTLLGLAHLQRGGRHRVLWGVSSVLAHAAGLFFWEKALVILPVAVAVHLLVVLADRPVRSRVGALRRLWRWWVAHLAVWVGYLAIYLSLTSTETFAAERNQSLAEAFRATVLQMALPGVFGVPWHTDGAANTLYPETGPWMVALALLAWAALVVASAVRNGGRACAGWLLLVAVLIVDFGLLSQGRPDFLGLVARDPRYVTDWLPIMVIGVCAAFSVPATAGRSVRPGGLRRPAAATAVVVLSTLAMSVQLVPVVQRDAGHDYVDRLTEGAAFADGALVFATQSPAGVSMTTTTPEALAAAQREVVFDQPGATALVPDLLGVLKPPELLEEVHEVGPEKDCGWPITERPTEVVDVGSHDRDRLVQVGLLLDESVVVHLRAGGAEQGVAVEAGLRTVWFRLPAGDGELELWVSPLPGHSATGTTRCVSDLRSGVPWQG